MTKKTLFILLTITAFIAGGCSTGTTPANNTAPANTKPAANSTPAAATPTNQAANSAATAPKPDDALSQTTGSASTPTGAYKAAYAARKNKDTKALRNLIAKDMVEFFEIMGEGEADPLEAGLKQLVDTPQGPSDDTRNEKISGDKATLEYLDKNGAWKTMDLVKEGGSWKLTIEKAGGGKKP